MSRRPQRTETTARRSKIRRLSLEGLETRELLSGFVVTTAADNGSNSAPTAGSLRAAILESNMNAVVGGNSISFDIPGSGPQIINLDSPLPAITGTTVIDGFSQPGYNGSPLIEINANSVASGTSGLEFNAGTSSVVRGLSIVGFAANAGSGGSAILIDGTATSTTIESNYLGVEPNGTTADANGRGVYVTTANNTIGGPTTPNGNLISGNVGGGVVLSGSGATANIVEGNLIGTNEAGSAAIGNNYGVVVTGPNNVIGGTSSGAANVISGNTGTNANPGVGVYLQTGATNETIEGNKIGTDYSGSIAIGNTYGVYFSSPTATSANFVSGETLGGTTSGAGNLISGNFIGITGNVTTSLIAGNLVGLNANGTMPLGNSDGFFLGLTGSTIGGTTAAARNVISASNTTLGDVGTGLVLSGVSDLIEGNYVGTTSAGVFGSGLGNVVGMNLDLDSSTIGGTTAGAANVISGNSSDGIQLSGTGSDGLFDNVIGQSVSGAALPNGGNGISITIVPPTSGTPSSPLALNDSIGGTTAGAGNTIANSGGAGILVDDTYPTGVTGLTIQGNVIKANAKLGIDLNGSGVPLASSLFINNTSVSGGQVTVSGVLFGIPGSTYEVDLFANSADGSGYGQGPVYLGSVNVTTNGSGFATFSPTYAEPSTAYSSFSATSTGPDGNTSEFSANYPLVATGPSADLSVISTTANTTVTAGTPFTLTETVTNNGPSTASGVVLYDSLPTTLVNTTVTSSQGSASFDSNNLLTDEIGSLTSGQSVTVTITATASAAGVFVDQPGVAGTTFDSNYVDNFSKNTITVNPGGSGPTADLGVTETASPSPTVGSKLTYTVTVTNYGPNTATNATVNDFLPTGVTLVSATPSQGASPTIGNGFLSDNLGSIASGSTATLIVVVTPTATGSITNAANVSGNQYDANKSNNSTSINTTVTAAIPSIDLVLAQSVYPQLGVVGQSQIFTMTVVNHGPDAATNVTLIDSLPAGATFVNAAPSQGGYASLVNGVITDDLGTIAAGASATLTVVVKPTVPGVLVNYAGAYSADVPLTIAPISFAYGAVSVPSGPSVVGLAKTNASKQIVVAFDETLNSSRATSKANYQLVSLGTTGTGPRKTISISSVSYNSTTRLVTITPSQAINPGLYYQLVVVGSTSTGISDTLGRRLVNPQYTTPGANYTVTFLGANLPTY
jgi:uncharacterized repeat protein (TIGR01451 family)